jgi:DNA-binding response OmpR family regulator
MRILFLTKDLIFPSQISKMVLQKAGELKVVTAEEQLLREAAHKPVALVILDLSTPDLNLKHLLPALRKQNSEIGPIVAFGPHVQASRLTAARQAGCDDVLTQGEFHRRVGALLELHCG